MYKNLILFAFAAAVGSSSASAKELTLKPTSPWNVVYEDDSCRLSSLFGTGNNQVVLHIVQYAPGERFNLTLSGRPVRTRNFEQEITFQFGPDEEPQEASVLGGKADKGDPAILFRTAVELAPPTDAEKIFSRFAYPYLADRAPLGRKREEAITFLRFAKGLRHELVLQTGSLYQPLEVLRKCSWDTVGHWGLDIDAQKNLRSPAFPKDNPKNWLVSGDYPLGMLYQGSQAVVHFRLMVDANGQPESCHIQSSTRLKTFDAAVCRGLMRRASFEPAKDQQGITTRSYFHSSVFFQIG